MHDLLTDMEALAFATLVATCAPRVDLTTARAIVATESSFNPHAVGVVGGRLDRQPRSRGEGIATARQLDATGYSYSVGLAQINVRNFGRLGLDSAKAFEPCSNLAAMQIILGECYDRAGRTTGSTQLALRRAVSCYYSGNFVTGMHHGYVRRVARAAASANDLLSSQPPTKE